MSTVGYQQLPFGLSVGLVFLLIAFYVAILSATEKRGTRFGGLMAAAFVLLSLGSLVLSFFPILSWRIEVVVLLVSDAVLILLISWVCLAQAGRLPRRRGQRAQSLEEVARRPRLRTILSAAPVVMFGCWLSYGTLLLIFPAPALDATAQAPPHFLLAAFIAALPEAFFSGLAAWLYLRASGRRTPTRTLRLKNLFYSGGTFSWFAVVLIVFASMNAQVTLPDDAREAVVNGLLVAEEIFTLTSLLSFALGLTLRYVPAVSEAVVGRVYPALLRLQDRLDTLRWQRVSGGTERRLIKASYYASDAAELLGFGEEDLRRCLTTLQIAAIMAGHPDQARQSASDGITPEMARELHRLQARLLREEALASRLRWPTDLAEDQDYAAEETVGPLHDAVEAALTLTSRTEPDQVDERFVDSLWYGLAVAAAPDAGVIPAGRPDGEPTNLAGRRARRAYHDAKESARQMAVG